MSAYYNENDKFAAAWLRNLIAENLIAPGDVDERSIVDVQPDDLRGYTQCHFFAGIGGWSYAARLAGWPDDQPVWTGSCPCQPFSAAGKGLGEKDPRHLWPEFRRLIAECNPAIVFGEQVASKAGRLWLSGVRADLEALGYAVGAADLCAAGIGAPHIRQRLFWVANATDERHAGRDGTQGIASGWSGPRPEIVRCGFVDRLAHADGWNASAERQQRSGEQRQQPQDGGASSGMGYADCGSGEQERAIGGRRDQGSNAGAGTGPGGDGIACGMGHSNDAGPQGRRQRPVERADQWSPWAAGEFIQCSDGKARRAQPGIFPLAHGVPNRVGTLRGAGNAINPQAAAEFMIAAVEAIAA